jgi:hypothetical protein
MFAVPCQNSPRTTSEQASMDGVRRFRSRIRYGCVPGDASNRIGNDVSSHNCRHLRSGLNMSRDYKNRQLEEPKNGAAMTFREIGRALGISTGSAFMTYKSAIHKLRRKRVPVRRLLEMATSKDYVEL